MLNPIEVKAQEVDPSVDFEEIDNLLNNIQDICNCSNFITLGEKNQVKHISSYQLTSPVSNRCIKVYGELVIDEPSFFIDCDFIMDAGSLITIEENGLMDITGSHLQSCVDTLWQGIKMEKNSHLLLKTSIFRHSYHGIHGNDQAVSVELLDNIFDNNFNGVDIGDIDYNGRLTTITMTGNIFAQTEAELKESWDGGPFIAEYYTNAVITRNARVFANASYNPEDDRNIVYKYFRGYRFFNSLAFVHSNLMKDFRVIQTGTFPEYGWGINNHGVNGGTGFLWQRGWVNDLNHSFENVRMPLVASNCDLSIRGNSIVEAELAITVHFASLVNDIDIRNNEMESSLEGIRIQEQPANRLNIRHNEITVDNDQYWGGQGLNLVPFGLLINNTSINPSNIDGRIFCNKIIAKSSRYGMRLINPRLRYVVYNEIQMSGSPYAYSVGLMMDGGTRNIVRESSIVTNHPSSRTHETYGINLTDSKNLDMLYNITRGSDYGVYFSASNRPLTMDRNVFENHDIGYYIEPAAFTGPQEYAGNRWKGTFHTWDALNDGDLGSNQIIEYNNHDYPPVNFNPGLNWILFTGTGSYGPYLSEFCDLVSYPPSGPVLGNFDYEIADGTYTPDEFPNRRLWNKEKELYDILREDPELLLTDSIYQEFWDDKQISSISEFSDVWNDFGNILTKSPGTQNSLDLAKENLFTLMKYADSLSIEMKYNPSDNELRDYFYSLQLDLDTLSLIHNTIQREWLDDVRNEMTNLIPTINGLPTPNLYAANEKLVLSALARYFIHPDSVYGQLYNDISNLSEQCIHKNGPAVIKAGALRTSLTGELVDFETYCPDPNSNRFVDEPSPKEADWILFPNPAKDVVSIVLDHPLAQEAEIRVYNSEGKSILRETINRGDESIRISTSGWQSGYYVVQVREGENSTTKSLIINK